MNNIEVSFVIPVYNGAESIGRVVKDICESYQDFNFEVIIVNDGSPNDNSEEVCAKLVDSFPEQVRFLHLARNFSEHNAVLAGMNAATGAYIAVLDDDGQNPPSEIRKMLAELKQHNYDVVYGRYKEKQHHWFRNLGSMFNDRMANIMLNKPPDLYLSSFKVMNRFVVNEVIKYKGAFPYIDGLIFRTTTNIGQIDVEHLKREDGASNYTLKRLVKLWLNMFLNFSITPLRMAVIMGMGMAAISVFLICCIVIESFINPDFPVGLPSIMVGIVFFAGIQMLMLGMIGEYLGRVFLDQSGTPQYVVRYEKSLMETKETPKASVHSIRELNTLERVTNE